MVQIHLDFFEDNLLFLLDVFGIKVWAQDEIGDDVESDRKMFIQHLGVEADLFLGGKSVEHPSNGIHLTRDRFGRAPFGTLKHHVLDKVSKTVFALGFAAGAVANPNSYGNGTDMGHRLGDDHEAMGQNVLFDVTHFRRHEGIVTYGSEMWREPIT